jgi:hypothetical protein
MWPTASQLELDRVLVSPLLDTLQMHQLRLEVCRIVPIFQDTNLERSTGLPYTDLGLPQVGQRRPLAPSSFS